MSTTSSMLNEEFGFVKYDEDILTKIHLFTSEEDHDELTCNCNYTNNYNNNNNGIKTKLYNNNNNNSNGNDEDHNALQFQVVDDNGDDLNNNNDDKSCAVLQQSINDDCSTAQSSSLIQQNSNEITTRQRSQQITCSTITKPSTETTNQVSSCYQQQHQLSLKNNININKNNNNKSDCDIKHEVDKNITSETDDSLLIRRRQSYLVISIDYHKKIEEQIDECDNKSYENRKRRPTLQLGNNLEIIPTENPILNDRRLSQISSLELFNNQNKKKRLSFIERMSALVTDPKDGGVVTIHDLPMTFQVKYLGHCPAKGLWGIKHTRGPVDTMVKVAKNLPPGQILPIVRVTISTKGITITQQVNNKRIENCYAIETISYGVQDLVYTRVFSMIVVYEDMKDQHPFECHAFVCESRNSARRLTYALAAAFQDYSKRVQETMKDDPSSPIKKKFAIDLRTPEEIQEDIEAETEA